MKSIRPYLILLAGGLVALAAGNIQAQTYSTPLEKLGISGTALEQGAANNAGTTIASPKKLSLSTGELLDQACADENANSNPNFPTTKPPKGATLYFNGSGFEIDSGTNQLADLTGDGIFTIDTGDPVVTSGSADGVGSAPYNVTDYSIATLTYTSPSSTLSFTVTGLATITSKATTPSVKTGALTVSGSISIASGAGSGSYNGTPMVLSGVTLSGSGSAHANNGQGTDDTGD